MSRGSPELTDSRKEEILNAFDKLFQIKSFRNISMRDIEQEISRIISSLCALTLMCSVVPIMPTYASAENLVSNSTFDYITSGWGTYYQSGGECPVSTKNGQLTLNVSKTGTVSYSVQLFYDIIPLYKNGVYRISYDISSDTDCTVEGGIQQNGGNYQAYTWEKLSLTSEPQNIDYTFTMKYDTEYVMPDDETEELIITPVSTTATADFCGIMALAYEIYQDIDETFAEQCLTSAEKAWQFLE